MQRSLSTGSINYSSIINSGGEFTGQETVEPEPQPQPMPVDDAGWAVWASSKLFSTFLSLPVDRENTPSLRVTVDVNVREVRK